MLLGIICGSFALALVFGVGEPAVWRLDFGTVVFCVCCCSGCGCCVFSVADVPCAVL